jgi:para-aminobenzoate synthetase component 1
MTLLIEELPYFPDSAALFLPWADRPWAVFLDGGHPHGLLGRYDIIAADPVKTLVTRKGITEIRDKGNTSVSTEDPFLLIQNALVPHQQKPNDLPFTGGAIGFFGYDLCRRLESLPDTGSTPDSVPEMMVGIYHWAVVVDHMQHRTFLIGQGHDPELHLRWPHLKKTFSQIQTIGWKVSDFEVLGDPTPNLNRPAYGRAFRKIQDYILEGDCYQVNLAIRFESSCRGNPWAAYQHLRTVNPSPFGAYLNYPEAQILSSSPERFLRVEQGQIETKPIKGTRPRSPIPEIDRSNAQSLKASLKDQAENLMIVDLLRNDIGKSAEPGSVSVPHLFEIESFPTVHHLVSTIRAELAKPNHALDLLRGCFPGGSITGAPKIRSMQIIEELEPHRRGVYCGSIGYIGFDGNMDTNIAIRTLVHSDQLLRFWAGGGIVADSDAVSEYEECYHKASAMLSLVEHFKHRSHENQYLGR